ncbi:MAG: hypothetical protein GC178_02765 [Flavobacteriales bacterium]|nr:hypothetical protein [Flavobacteriales bacterium]
MKNIIKLVALLLVIGCSEKETTVAAQETSMDHSSLIDTVIAYEHPYDLSIDIENAGPKGYNLLIRMDLFGGSFFASPYAGDKLKGRFSVVLDENDHVRLGKDFIETPRSQEVFDPQPFVDGNVNWITVNTVYNYPVEVSSHTDFKVNGMIRFTIEPKCTFEEIPFSISSESGKVTVQRYPKLDKRTCSAIPVLEVSLYESPKIDHEVAVNHPYDIDFRIAKTDEGELNWLIFTDLFGGSFYVSPHSTADFKGKFRVEVAPNDDLEVGADFIEIPCSKEVFDPHPFIRGPVNWVSENTTYEYPLILHTDQDFEIGGKVLFVIEPKCTLEEIPVIFKYKNGVLRVEKWAC